MNILFIRGYYPDQCGQGHCTSCSVVFNPIYPGDINSAANYCVACVSGYGPNADTSMDPWLFQPCYWKCIDLCKICTTDQLSCTSCTANSYYTP